MVAAIWSGVPSSSSPWAPVPANMCRPSGWSGRARRMASLVWRGRLLNQQQDRRASQQPGCHEGEREQRHGATTNQADQRRLDQAIAQSREENAAYRNLLAEFGTGAVGK